MRIYYCNPMSFFGERALKLFNKPRYQGEEGSVLFLGLYFEEDYFAFLSHKGNKYVFWHGSDVSRMLNNKNYVNIIQHTPAIHACHNEQLQKELKSIGIDALIRPIFFGDINNYNISFKPSKKTEVYMITHWGRNDEYGVPMASKVTQEMGIELHTYENIPEEQMNSEIKNFHSCLRLNQHDGFSQTVMKSVLLGQYPITYKKIDGIWQARDEEELFEQLIRLKRQKEPNYDLRNKYIKQLNNFDWLK